MAIITRRTAFQQAAGALGALVPGLVFAPRLAALTQGSGLKFEVYKDNRASFRWRLKAANGRVIATSGEGYKAKADCRNAIELIQRGAATAGVVDMTTTPS